VIDRGISTEDKLFFVMEFIEAIDLNCAMKLGLNLVLYDQ